MVYYVFQEMRIKSWVKNLFVLSPIVFARELFEAGTFLSALLLTLAFCLVSSGVYIFNDINDLEKDRNHSVKRNRPIAAGKISVPVARILCVILVLAGLGLAYGVNIPAVGWILFYLVMNIAYSKWLKQKPVIDCFCIAAGFVLRVMVGGTIVEAGISDWMFLTIISFSLFMALGKRRGELVNYDAAETRSVLGSYEKEFLNGSIFMCAGLTTVFYSLWCLSQGEHLVYTVPVILFIVLRYLLLLFAGKAEGDPTNLILTDRTMLTACAVCALIMLLALYGPLILY